jgi:predicted AlkP superfamily phosphohydrolase/phosphomutase
VLHTWPEHEGLTLDVTRLGEGPSDVTSELRAAARALGWRTVRLSGAPSLSALLGAVAVALAVSAPGTAEAYVGPGAGIALLTGLATMLFSLFLGAVSLLLYPLRLIYRRFTRKKAPNPARIKRAVLIGLDGLDPDLVQRFMDQGKLPTFSKLAQQGMFRPLGTTTPAMSPVAWSSFATGVHPSKHGIYDFLTRDRHTYLPDLSSTHIGPAARSLRIGSWTIPLGKPTIKLLRKSTPFWKILGEHQIPSAILRVPITFPPDHFDGIMLSAMCVPDLQGSQGTFTYCSCEESDGEAIGGMHVRLTPEGAGLSGRVPGPDHPLRADTRLGLPFRLVRDGEGWSVRMHGAAAVPLPLAEYTEWLEVAYPLGLGLKLRGICRMRLLEGGDAPRLYISPVNIDPARPVMPISQPFVFSIFLAKLIGKFGTLGLAEDTWALNEGVLDEEAFLQQAWANHGEREAMFFEMLDRTEEGVIACVFDGTDRIQHMFMRYLDEGHPAARTAPNHEKYRGVIEETYIRMDEMLDRALAQVDADDPEQLFIVLSDHGFKSFRRGVNVNSWLLEQGYLVLKEGADASGEWFQDVDWPRTRAFALGLAGLFLNIRGREAQGCVEPEDAEALAAEIAAKLTGLVDGEVGDVAVKRALAKAEIFSGPYAHKSPDVIVGYAPGWRASWRGVRGVVDDVVFDDNTKAWSGDHCIDPAEVPGVLFANWNLGAGREELSITDLAPTLLELFGIPTPRWMDGTSLAPSSNSEASG